MKSQALNTELNNLAVSQKHNFIEKLSLGGMAFILLVLSVMDCKMNDRFTNPFLSVTPAEAMAGTGSGIPIDVNNIFSFTDKPISHMKALAVASVKKPRTGATTFGHAPVRQAQRQAAGHAIAEESTMIAGTNDLKETVVKAKRIVKNTRRQHHGFSIPIHIEPGIRIAPEVGLAENGFYHNNTSNVHTNGIVLGVVADMSLNKHVALQPELKFMVKGNETVTPTVAGDANVNMINKTSLSYVELPVNVVYKFGSEKKTQVITGGGPYIAYLESASNKGTVAGNNGTTGVAAAGGEAALPPTNETAHKVDYGVNGFVGCQTPEGFFAKASAEAGLRNINENTGSNRNYNFVISVGYLFGGK